jgi:hypothetical protein
MNRRLLTLAIGLLLAAGVLAAQAKNLSDHDPFFAWKAEKAKGLDRWLFTGQRTVSSDSACDPIHSVSFTDWQQVGTDNFPSDVKCSSSTEKRPGQEEQLTVFCRIPEVQEVDTLMRSTTSPGGAEYRATWEAIRTTSAGSVMRCSWTGWVIDLPILDVKRPRTAAR